jgi:hypothetical protein
VGKHGKILLDQSEPRVTENLFSRRTDERLDDGVGEGATKLRHLTNLPPRRWKEARGQRLVPFEGESGEISDDAGDGFFAGIAGERHGVDTSRADSRVGQN